MPPTSDEPFFVKNLERVQGDERDAIILSVGYGKRNADGRLTYHFGPILREKGERRLNVAITRARSRLTVVSSFGAEDMDPARSTNRGVELLRAYLAYVASGGDDLGSGPAEHPQLNPFEIDVRDRLVAAGVPVVAQYGVSGMPSTSSPSIAPNPAATCWPSNATARAITPNPPPAIGIAYVNNNSNALGGASIGSSPPTSSPTPPPRWRAWSPRMNRRWWLPARHRPRPRSVLHGRCRMVATSPSVSLAPGWVNDRRRTTCRLTRVAAWSCTMRRAATGVRRGHDVDGDAPAVRLG